MIGVSLAQMATEWDEGLAIETVYLAHQSIHQCRGCRVCFDKGEEKCPLKDDLLSIRTKMDAADGLIVATPVYVNDVSGTVKNWLDRLAFVCHRPRFAGKSAYLLATVGNGPANHALKTLKMALNSWGYHVVGQAGFRTGARMKTLDMEAHYRRQVEQIAHQLYRAVERRSYGQPSFLSLLYFKIQQRYWQQHGCESFDRRYWQDKGWIEPQREYYIPHQANRLKVFLARLSGAALARFVT